MRLPSIELRRMNEREPVVHAHPLPHCAGSTEYFLPQPELPEHVRSSLPPWMLSIANTVTPVLTRIIDERFAQIEHPALQPLSDQLRSYSPVSVIVRNDEQSWVRLDPQQPQTRKISPDLSGRVIGSSAYIPSLPNERRIQEQLDSTGFSKNATFSAFARHFCGLAEDFAVSGSFLEGTKNWLILCENWQEETIANYNQWRGSLLFYHARNSDQLCFIPMDMSAGGSTPKDE